MFEPMYGVRGFVGLFRTNETRNFVLEGEREGGRRKRESEWERENKVLATSCACIGLLNLNFSTVWEAKLPVQDIHWQKWSMSLKLWNCIHWLFELVLATVDCKKKLCGKLMSGSWGFYSRVGHESLTHEWVVSFEFLTYVHNFIHQSCGYVARAHESALMAGW